MKMKINFIEEFEDSSSNKVYRDIHIIHINETDILPIKGDVVVADDGIRYSVFERVLDYRENIIDFLIKRK